MGFTLQKGKFYVEYHKEVFEDHYYFLFISMTYLMQHLFLLIYSQMTQIFWKHLPTCKHWSRKTKKELENVAIWFQVNLLTSTHTLHPYILIFFFFPPFIPSILIFLFSSFSLHSHPPSLYSFFLHSYPPSSYSYFLFFPSTHTLYPYILLFPSTHTLHLYILIFFFFPPLTPSILIFLFSSFSLHTYPPSFYSYFLLFPSTHTLYP